MIGRRCTAVDLDGQRSGMRSHMAPLAVLAVLTLAASRLLPEARSHALTMTRWPYFADAATCLHIPGLRALRQTLAPCLPWHPVKSTADEPS